MIVRDDGASAQPVRPALPEGHYSCLPETVHLEDTIATHDVQPRADVDVGRDSERDFMLRYAG